MIQPPVAIALTVCEQVIIEEKTHNVTLVNCLMRLRVREIPSQPQRLVVYARLTDGIGTGKIRVEMAHLDTFDAFLIREISAIFADPLEEYRVVLRETLSFPAEGYYQVTLLADGIMIAQRTLQVFVKEEPS